jgi:hypothetical protein
MRTLFAACAALLVLSACSSESEEPAPAPTTESSSEAPASGGGEDELRAAVTAYSEAFLSGDGATAYGYFSSRCQDRVPLSDFAAAVEQAGETYGPMAIESLDVTLNGTQAQATYTYSDSDLDQTNEPWVDEDGWRVDDC